MSEASKAKKRAEDKLAKAKTHLQKMEAEIANGTRQYNVRTPTLSAPARFLWRPCPLSR